MSDLKQLEARVHQLEKQLLELPQKILLDVKKLVDMHVHEMGGKIIWKVPIEDLKKVLEEQAASIKAAAKPLVVREKVTINDELIITKNPVEAK